MAANNFSTHTIRKYPTNGTTMLFRNRDGMVIAGVGPDSHVDFGEDPHTPQRRQFISQVHAIAFLRVVADTDYQEYMATQPREDGVPQADISTYHARIEEDSDTNITVVKH